MLKITTLYDNYIHSAIPGLRGGWGFSCLVEYDDKVILFDAGADGRILLSNAERLRVDLERVQVLVLSHDHGDHTGGLAEFLSVNRQALVYLGESFSAELKDFVAGHAAGLREVGRAVGIVPRIFTTGELGSGLKEQSLVLDFDHRLALITGCAHPGIAEITRFAASEFGSGVYLVMGGFHLGGMPGERVRRIAEELKAQGVQKAAPSHCTGDDALSIFREVFGDGFITAGVGTVIELGEHDSPASA